MEGNINELILKRIDSISFDEAIKSFLKKVLLLELQHRMEGGRWSSSKEYELDLKHYTEKYKGE